MKHSPASLGRRSAAFAIDASGYVVLAAVLIALPAGIANATRMSPGVATAMVVSGAVAWLCAAVAYALRLAGGKGGGGTLGMRRLGIAVVDIDDGDPIGKERAVLRGIVQLASWLSVVGVVSPLFDRRRRAWHDKAVAALVVDSRDPAGVAPGPALQDAEDSGDAGPAGGADLISALPAFASAVGVPEDPDAPDGDADAEEPVRLAPIPRADGPVSTPVFEPAPAPPAAVIAVPAPEPVSPVDVGLSEEDMATRVSPQRRQSALRLVWDDGGVSVIGALTVLGRDPSIGDLEGAVAVAIADGTRSLSKTHFAIGFDGGHAYIVDRQSTNGTTVVRAGGEGISLAPGVRERVRAGDTVVIGDRNFRIEEDL